MRTDAAGLIPEELRAGGVGQPFDAVETNRAASCLAIGG
jgi:hypothetical protein